MHATHICKPISALVALLVVLAAPACTRETAQVTVDVGPTSIPGGDALGATDITVRNDRFAVAFAVETAPPWGVARGGIVDVAVVRDGELSADRASLVDFMPNDWSDWPTSYQNVTLESQAADEVIVRTERDWGSVRLVTTFTIRAGDNKLHMLTEMMNDGDEPLSDLSSGYVLWPDGGFIFGIPGVRGLSEGPTTGALAGWSAFYDEDWAFGLHAGFDDRINNDARDRYLLHSLGAGETRRFEAWLQIDDRGELAPLVASAIELEGLSSGRVSGMLTEPDGNPVTDAVVVAEKITGTGSYPYAWVFGEDGNYSFQLPVGSYRLYATAKGYARSSAATIELTAGQAESRDFSDLRPPGELTIKVVDEESGAPLDARIVIEEGDAPLIGYFGKATHFTELGAIGEVSLSIAPGNYRFRVSRAEGFTAAPVFLDIEVASADSREVTAVIDVVAEPRARGWYGADLHHHSDVLDGYTAPHFVLSSELAAGVDIAFLSDHDSMINNQKMSQLAAERGIPFIPATELSPSWAHFNAYPIEANETISIEVGKATVQEIFAEARRLGADIVQVNHPYIDYGYFRARENEAVPGGFSDEFDLVEISSTYSNEQTVTAVWNLWNEGKRRYFSAGSDAHDVWQEVSGAVRMYVHVDGELTIGKFVEALRSGHSYASAGPLIFPETMFGEEISHVAGEPLELGFSLQSVRGLARVTLVQGGNPVETMSFDGDTALTPVTFTVRPAADSWFSLVVLDSAGKAAYTNPVWVNMTN
jgi:hypothetical protein